MDNEKNKVEKSTLYLVGTPIGNLLDMSERAIKVLREVDFIAAEDTRNSMKLCSIFGIKKEFVSYHEHNKRESGEKIIARLVLGESCALVTDAGMPAISDPGEDIVRLAAENGVRVSVIPGPSAVVSALALSALSTKRFAFEGFLPTQKSEKKKRLASLSREVRTMVFYEAPHKLRATLSDLLECFGEDRKISLAREITKLNEEVMRTTLAKACEYYKEKEPRGEYVLVVEGSPDIQNDSPLAELTPEEHIAYYMEKGLSKMEATKSAAKDRKISKSEMYKLVNQ